MQTQVTDAILNQAVESLRQGKVVAFPTDTVYGVGADPFQPDAVRKLYHIKGRPLDKPIPILVGSLGAVEHVARDLPPAFFALVKQFWPGALTLVVPARALPPEITAGGTTVGVRMPAHPIALELLRRFGGAIATTSANVSDAPPATNAVAVQEQLGEQIAFILDGGPTLTKVASTVLDLSVSPPRIRRHGGISAEQLSVYVNPLTE